MKNVKSTIVTLLLFLGLISFSMSAMAHNSKDEDGGQNKCAKTDLIQFNGTIAQAVAQTPNLSTFNSLVGLVSGVEAAFNDPFPLNVFAPVNSAFDRIPATLVDLLTSDPNGVLSSVLYYHVSAGMLDPRIKNHKVKEVGTVLKQSLFLNGKKNNPQVNQSNIDCQGIKASNGVIWLIDSVLLPQF